MCPSKRHQRMARDFSSQEERCRRGLILLLRVCRLIFSRYRDADFESRSSILPTGAANSSELFAISQYFPYHTERWITISLWKTFTKRNCTYTTRATIPRTILIKSGLRIPTLPHIEADKEQASTGRRIWRHGREICRSRLNVRASQSEECDEWWTSAKDEYNCAWPL
jgi:hypothetical protein